MAHGPVDDEDDVRCGMSRFFVSRSSLGRFLRRILDTTKQVHKNAGAGGTPTQHQK